MSALRVASTPCQSLSPARWTKWRTRREASIPLDRLRAPASRSKRRAKSPPIEARAARATCGLEQVETISRTIICCAFSDDGKLIVAGDVGGCVHFLRLEEPKAKSTMEREFVVAAKAISRKAFEPRSSLGPPSPAPS